MPVVIQTIIDDKAVFATVRSSDKAIARAQTFWHDVINLKVDEGSQVKRGAPGDRHILSMTSSNCKWHRWMRSSRPLVHACNKAQKDLKRGQNLKRKRGVMPQPSSMNCKPPLMSPASDEEVGDCRALCIE